MRSARSAVVLGLWLAFASATLAGQHDPLAYKPPTFPNAQNHLKLQFLPPERH